jgi:hypothetical protein
MSYEPPNNRLQTDNRRRCIPCAPLAAEPERSADMRTWDGNPLLVSETFIRLSTEALPDVYEIDAHKRAGPPLVELQV